MNQLAILVVIAAILIFFVISTLPDCKPGEVMARGAFGFVCVQGHK